MGIYYYDGSVKSGLLWDESTSAWTYHSGAPTTDGAQSYYKAIPTIYRGVAMIANAVSTVPFQVKKGKTVIDDSTDWKNALVFLPNPRRVFALTSMSLDLTGCAYWSPRANKAAITKELQYFMTSTVKPVFDDATGQLTEFERTRPKMIVPEKIKPQELYYFWLQDPYVEIGPPTAYPVKAALSAAGVLANLNSFVAQYFDRGAIRAQLVFAKGMPEKGERERLEHWFNQLLGGIKNAFRWRIFNADTLSTQTIGDGLDQLRDVELTEAQRQDIAQALGIPYSRLFSDAANYATANQDALDFYEQTIEPRCEFIASVYNEQILKPMGYSLEFTPESLRVYQEEERQRAQAVGNLVSALDKPEQFMIAASIMGYEIPDEAQKMLEKLMQKKEEEKEQMQAQLEQQANQPPGNQREQEPEARLEARNEQRAEVQAEAERWRRKSLNAVKRGKSPNVEFDSRIIPAALSGAIAGALDASKTARDVERVFANVWEGYP